MEGFTLVGVPSPQGIYNIKPFRRRRKIADTGSIVPHDSPQHNPPRHVRIDSNVALRVQGAQMVLHRVGPAPDFCSQLLARRRVPVRLDVASQQIEDLALR